MSQNFVNKYRPWAVTFLLFLFMVINFCDKAVLGVVAVSVMHDLDLRPAQFGLIASSFFFLFSLSMVSFGFIATRVRAKVLLIICALIWAVAQFPLAFVGSVPVLFFSRILLGIGEGPAYPLANHACYQWFSNERRNLPAAILSQGATVGILVAGPLLTYVMTHHGWHAAFFLLGTASVVWVVLWSLIGAEGSNDANAKASKSQVSTQARAPYLSMITDRTFVGSTLLVWSTYFVFSLVFSWLPSYLRTVLHYDATDAGWMMSLFTSFAFPIVLIGSWASQRMLRRGVASKYARGWLISGFSAVGGSMILLAINFVANPLDKAVIMAIGWTMPQLSFVLVATIMAEIAPDGQRPALMSLSSAIGTTGGLVAPALVGYLIQHAGTQASGYLWGFGTCGVLSLMAGVIGFILINPAASKERFARLADETAMRRQASLGAEMGSTPRHTN